MKLSLLDVMDAEVTKDRRKETDDLVFHFFGGFRNDLRGDANPAFFALRLAANAAITEGLTRSRKTTLWSFRSVGQAYFWFAGR